MSKLEFKTYLHYKQYENIQDFPENTFLLNIYIQLFMLNFTLPQKNRDFFFPIFTIY